MSSLQAAAEDRQWCCRRHMQPTKTRTELLRQFCLRSAHKVANFPRQKFRILQSLLIVPSGSRSFSVPSLFFLPAKRPRWQAPGRNAIFCDILSPVNVAPTLQRRCTNVATLLHADLMAQYHTGRVK